MPALAPLADRSPSLRRVGARLALFLAGVLLVAGCARLGGEVLQSSHNAVLPVTPERTVGQTFTVAGSGITGVDLLVATYGAPADPTGVLRVALHEELGGALVAEVEVPGSDVEDNAWVAVDFDGAQPVEGRPAIEVFWDGSTPVALRANVPSHPIDPDVLVNDPYPEGELVLGGALAAGDLAFRVRGADGLAATPRVVSGLVRGLAGGLRDRPLFAAFWGLAVLGCAVLAIRGLRGAAPDDPQSGEPTPQEPRVGQLRE